MEVWRGGGVGSGSNSFDCIFAHEKERSEIYIILTSPAHVVGTTARLARLPMRGRDYDGLPTTLI